jgi:hypothetical protein
MRIQDRKIPYPKDRKSDLDFYNEKMVPEEDFLGPARPEEPYQMKPIENKVIQVKKQELISPVLKKIVAGEHRTTPKPLKNIGLNIAGDIFDRTRFLQERIEEIQTFIHQREQMHAKVDAEIEAEIKEFETMIASISDREELREFKVNLNLLKMEQRRENDNYWRDTMALKQQLRELREQFQLESKISGLFSDLEGY